MSLARPERLFRAWLLLLAITAASVATAEFLGLHRLAVAAVMLIAGAKVTIILRRFMDVGQAPAGIRHYLTFWTAGCATMIFALWVLAAGG